jgi:hypothetical protein
VSIALKSKPGLTGSTALSIPKDWDPSWFRSFIHNMLKGADVRNAVGTNGITVTGNISSPYATISGAGILGSIVGTPNEIVVTVAGGTATISISPTLVLPGSLTVTGASTFTAPVIINPTAGDVSLTVNGASGQDGVIINTPSDNQLHLNAESGGRFSTLSFDNNGTPEIQLFWDQTGGLFHIGGTTLNGAGSVWNIPAPASSGTTLTLNSSTVSDDLLDLNSTGALASRVVWLNSGTPYGYASSALSILGGSTSNTDFCLYAANQLVLSAGTGGELVTINGGGSQVLSINGATTLPLLLTTSSSGPWALEITRSDVGSTIHVYNNATSSSNGYWNFNEAVVAVNNGLMSGSPTGGLQGTGTVNATAYYVNGVALGSPTHGTFTGTLTGMAAATTGTVSYITDGQYCMLYVTANILGTSNATTMSLTGLPSACQPATGTFGSSINMENGSASEIVGGFSTVSSHGGTVNFYTITGSQLVGTGFTASGSKGLAAGWLIVYPVV